MAMLLVVVVLCGGLLQVTTAEITCYECTDDPDNAYHTYDPQCGSYHYQGHTDNMNGYDTCGIGIFNNGYTKRFIATTVSGDGECNYPYSLTECLCKGILCNSNSFCAQCGYPRPTPGTTEATTTTTTTVTTTPTPLTTHVTTTLATTSVPLQNIKCYSCVGCFIVEEGTTPVVEDGFTSCMTTVYQDRSQVIRGGSYEEHPDGECIGNKEAFSCWCSSKDLCNADAMDI
ncbi:unnamed protein product [Meganyctiphanes norvegica]|uniref:Uncharacterized protein n=1 Tax=Meganyctiphanes norvegica TaxID=48144 RepID=A0AAV2RB32_MEGNR